MPRNNNATTLPDRIPASLSTEIEKTFSDQIASEVFRKRVKEIFDDYIGAVDFMKKVKEYAKEQIELSVYQNIGFWVKTIGIPIVVTIATLWIARQLGLK